MLFIFTGLYKPSSLGSFQEIYIYLIYQILKSLLLYNNYYRCPNHTWKIFHWWLIIKLPCTCLHKRKSNNLTLHNNLSPDEFLAFQLLLKCSHLTITITVLYFGMRKGNFMGWKDSGNFGKMKVPLLTMESSQDGKARVKPPAKNSIIEEESNVCQSPIPAAGSQPGRNLQELQPLNW